MFINVNTKTQALADGTPAPNSAVPSVFFQQKNLVLAVNFIDDSGNLVTTLFTATDSFSFAADEDFDRSATLPWILTPDSGFNVPGDRPDLDVAGGKISIRLDANTGRFGTGIGVLRDKQLNAQIKAFSAAETEPKSVFSHFIEAFNLIENTGAGPTAPVSNFYTKAEADALHAGLEDLRTRLATSIDAKVAATTDIQTTPALRARIVKNFIIRTTAITGAAGLPSIEIKTDGGAILVADTVMPVGAGVVGGLMRLESTHDKILAAGEKTQLRIVTPGTSTTHIISVYDDGIEVDA